MTLTCPKKQTTASAKVVSEQRPSDKNRHGSVRENFLILRLNNNKLNQILLAYIIWKKNPQKTGDFNLFVVWPI